MRTTVDYSTASSLLATAERVTPGGVHSNVRLDAPRVFFDHAKGSRMWDVAGNDYIDYLLGQGPNFLGHAPDDVNAFVMDATRKGMVYGAQHPLEVEASDHLLERLGWAGSVRFGVSGTECVQAALRLARAATGRRKVVRFEGHYHGWLDDQLINVVDHQVGPGSAGQVVSRLEDLVVLPWNDADSLARALSTQGSDVAAVIMEPIMCNQGVVPPRPGYLEAVRHLCDEFGAILIFDETITGFRVGPRGAIGTTGVVPDLATYGKALGGGWPVAALAGNARLMEMFGDGRVNHSGTFNASVMATAAVVASMRHLDLDPPYERITEVGTLLMDGLRALAATHGVALAIQGLPAAFHASIFRSSSDLSPYQDYAQLQRRRNLQAYARLSRLLTEHGVWVAARGIWYVSAAHSRDDVAETLERAGRAMEQFDG